MTTPEGEIKAYLSQRCYGVCWLCLPLVNPKMLGWPDRTILAWSDRGGGYIALVEAKATTTRHKAAHLERQRKCQELLRGLGFLVFVVSTKEEVDQMFEALIHQYGWPGDRG